MIRCSSCGMILARGVGAACAACRCTICANCEVHLADERVACFVCCAPPEVLPVGVALDEEGERVLLGDPRLFAAARGLSERVR